MPISSINRSSTPPLAKDQRPTEITKTGTHNDRVVSESASGKADNFSSLSSSIPLGNLRSRKARKPTTGENRGIFNTLRLRFSGRQRHHNRGISSPRGAAALEAKTMDLVKGQTSIMIEASQSGMAAARANIVRGFATEKSSEEVAACLQSGDKGIRRGTTAILNLSRMLSFENLSDEEKQKMPAESLESLKKQSTQIRGMAKTISDAAFLDSKSNFFQCGTTEGNGYVEMMKKHPEQDQTMRGWIRDGLTLGSELINTQEQILIKGRTQSEDYLNDVQSRVNIFASVEKDPFVSVGSDSEMEGFAADVMSKMDKETEV